MKDEMKKNLEANETPETNQDVENENKKPRRKIFTKRNMIKAAKFVGAFTLGFAAKTVVDMVLGGTTSTQAAPEITTTEVDGVTTTTF